MPFDYSSMMLNYVGRYTVGFVEKGEDRARSLGSGTLATYDNKVGGIITCAHVLEALPSEFGLVTFPARDEHLQMMTIPISATHKIILGQAPWTESGPDLGFLRLPDAMMADLGSVASVLDASRHRNLSLAGEPEGKKLDLVSGLIDEETKTTITGTTAVTYFKGLLNAGKVVEKGENGGFDWVRFEPMPDSAHLSPQTYGGTSGGGLWRLYLKQDDETLLHHARLVGVAFWQKPMNGQMHIVCHGVNSVHERLFKEVATRFGL